MHRPRALEKLIGVQMGGGQWYVLYPSIFFAIVMSYGSPLGRTFLSFGQFRKSLKPPFLTAKTLTRVRSVYYSCSAL